MKYSILMDHPLDHPLDRPLDRDPALDQHLQLEVAVGVGLRVKLLQTVTVMLSVGLVKSSVPELAPVYGVRRHLFEGRVHPPTQQNIPALPPLRSPCRFPVMEICYS